MPSVSLKSGRYLMFASLLLASAFICLSSRVVLARGEPVRAKNLEFQDNEWASGEAKQQNGVFDDLVEQKKKKPAAQAPALADSSNVTPMTPKANVAADASADTSTSESTSSTWVWAILGALFVGGGGLTVFGWYWSNMRRATPW